MQGSSNFTDAAIQPRVGNRRVTIRYRCPPAMSGGVVASDDLEYQKAWIDNLSRGGIGLYLSKPVAATSLVVVHLKCSTTANRLELTGQVAHASLREPYGWYVGIQFLEPIDEDVLESLL